MSTHEPNYAQVFKPYNETCGTIDVSIKIPPKPPTLWQRFQAWRERTGFFMDGKDGGM